MRTTERSAARDALLGFARGVVKAVSSRANQAKMQHIDVSVLHGETHEGAEHAEPYGMTAKPHAGAEVFIAYVGGKRAHPIILAVADRKYRMQGLADGEVAIYDDLGQSVHLTRDGVVMTSPTSVKTVVGGVSLEVTSAGAAFTGGTLTHNGKNVGDTHLHGGVIIGGSNTTGPV